MADVGMPDVLTPAQMAKLGGVAHPDDLPDTLTPEQMDRATEAPREYPPTEDEKLGIDTPLAKPTGLVWDSRNREFRRADQIGTEKALLPGFVPERPLIREDPAMDVATTIAGAGAGKVAGEAIGKLSPIVARLAEPAVAGATTSALQGGDRMTNLKAAGIGAALGIPGAALEVVRGAPAAVAERLPTAVTGGLKSKAAKKVVAGGAVDDALEAHPQLKRVLATSADPGERLGAASSTLNKLTAANDKVYEAIQAQHQGIPLDPVAAKIRDVAKEAHAAGDAITEDAANAAAENLGRFADVADKRGGVVTTSQLRGVRNTLAARIQAASPGLPMSDAQAAADRIRRAINEGIEDVAAQTSGVDVAALKERNRHIAQLLPVQQSLREQAIAKGLKVPEDHLADFIAHPQHTIAGLVRAGRAKLDVKLAESPALQRLAAGARSPLPDLANRALMGGAAAAGARGKRQQSDLEYAARVSQLMDQGMTLQEATQKAEESP